MAKKTKKAIPNNRTPIVAVMGHVDHGKTSILDAIRGTHVQTGEEGGITQNTRAHSLETKDGRKITFVDTPGHEAFSNMRERGAAVTDIVLLVVAADDGVKPQTKESIKFAKKAGVPIVVAINKMDLPGANPAKVKQELSQYDVLVEEFGGDVLVSEVSAVKKKGLDEMLDNLLLQAELMELKPEKLEQGIGSGYVLESNLDNKLGPVAMVIVKKGELNDKSIAVSENYVHKIRDLLDENQQIKSHADQGEPVWLIGLEEVLNAGEEIVFFAKNNEAKEFSKRRQEVKKASEKSQEVESLEDEDLLASLFETQEQEDEVKKLNIVLRADTKGTLEAIEEKLMGLNDEEAEINILSKGTGDITMKDVHLAKSSRAIVIGFQVLMPAQVEQIAKRDRVLYRIYTIIYNLLDEIEVALGSLLEPIEEEIEVARAKVKQVFVLSNGLKVAGSEVIKGTILKGYTVFVERNGEEVGRGKITSLKHAKEEVKEMKKGQECGIMIEPQVDIEEGDEVVAYRVERL